MTATNTTSLPRQTMYRTLRISVLVLWSFWGGLVSPTVAAELKDSPQLAGGAMAEMAALQTALELFELDYGYYVSLETLDDIDVTPTTPQHNYVFNAPGLRVLRPHKGVFESTPLLTLPSPPYKGPYATYQPGTTQTGTTPYDEGSPLDPWNRPYLLFSPLGLVRGDTGAVTHEYHGDSFDRWAIVSLGPDGQPDTVTAVDDDIIRLFSIGVTGPAISSVSGPQVTAWNYPAGTVYIAPAGASLTIRGYNLGATQGTSQVWFGAAPVPGVITLWSPTMITLTLSSALAGYDVLTVRVGPVATPVVTNGLFLLLQANASHDWELFE